MILRTLYYIYIKAPATRRNDRMSFKTTFYHQPTQCISKELRIVFYRQNDINLSVDNSITHAGIRSADARNRLLRALKSTGNWLGLCTSWEPLSHKTLVFSNGYLQETQYQSRKQTQNIQTFTKYKILSSHYLCSLSVTRFRWAYASS